MANSYLTRSISSTGTNTKGTFSGWIKRSELTNNYPRFFAVNTDSNNYFRLFFHNDDKLHLYIDNGGSGIGQRKTTRLFRDTNAWYHIVVAIDSTLATAGDRIKVWVNGVQETAFDSTINPSQNADMKINNSGSTIVIGKHENASSDYFSGYMSHVSWVDGAALAPTVFGETDSTSGIWKFKAPSGVTWGTNGVHLKFENSGALGTDSSGNSNTFTVNGDLKQSIDTPSIVYPTLNVVANTNSNSTISDGGLTHTVSGQWLGAISTFGVTSGKWYAEAKITDEQNFNIGFATLVGSFINNMNTANSGYVGKGDDSWGFWGNGANNAQKVHNNSATNYGSAFSTNDIMILAMDVDNKKLYFGKNGTFFDSSNPATQASPAFTFTTTEPMGFASGPENGAVQWNFGAGNFGDTPITSAGSNGNGSLFEYDVPSGFYALNTKNINTYG